VYTTDCVFMVYRALASGQRLNGFAKVCAVPTFTQPNSKPP